MSCRKYCRMECLKMLNFSSLCSSSLKTHMPGLLHILLFEKTHNQKLKGFASALSVELYEADAESVGFYVIMEEGRLLLLEGNIVCADKDDDGVDGDAFTRNIEKWHSAIQTILDEAKLFSKLMEQKYPEIYRQTNLLDMLPEKDSNTGMLESSPTATFILRAYADILQQLLYSFFSSPSIGKFATIFGFYVETVMREIVHYRHSMHGGVAIAEPEGYLLAFMMKSQLCGDECNRAIEAFRGRFRGLASVDVSMSEPWLSLAVARLVVVASSKLQQFEFTDHAIEFMDSATRGGLPEVMVRAIIAFVAGVGLFYLLGRKFL